MKGTKLWQAPRSPLISGRSRRERSFSRDWTVGSVLAGFIAAGIGVAVLLPKGVNTIDDGLILLGVVIVAAAAGCAPAVWIARQVGWRPPWVAGSIGGALFATGALGGYIVWFATAVGK